MRAASGILLAVLAVAACAGDAAAPDSGEDLVARYALTSLPPMMYPPDNPLDSARIALGRLLFFDPVLSATGDVACGTCHIPEFGMTDGRDLPAGPSGIGLGPARTLTDPTMRPEARNSMTIINVGFNRFLRQMTADGFLFWDGRRRRLENLATLPMLERSEMRGDVVPPEHALAAALERLRAIPEYEALFRAAFTDRPGVSAIDSVTLSRALAQFLRSVVSDGSAWDRFVAGDRDALTPEQRRGLVLFHGKGGCVRCHPPPLFSDFDFHVVGARQLGAGFKQTPHQDFGRWNATGLEADRWSFRTPTLRNVTETAPYMHSGGYANLREVLEFLRRGGGDLPGVPANRIELHRLSLTDGEIDDIIAFLRALSDPPGVQPPDRVPSGLPVPRLEQAARQFSLSPAGQSHRDPPE